MTQDAPAGRGIPLRALVTTPLLLLLAATVGLTGWLLISNGLRAADEITAELAREVGDRVEDYVASYLEQAHLVNDLNANAVLHGELGGEWESEAIGRHFWSQLRLFDDLTFAFVGTRHGGAAGAGRVQLAGLGAVSGERIVLDTTDVDPELGLVAGTRREFIALEDGTRGAELPTSRPFDARTRPWFEAARERGGPVWSEVYRIARDESVLAIAASRPVYGADGELWGVMGVDVTLEAIGAFLSTLSDRGEVFIFEPQGQLVATSRPDEQLWDDAPVPGEGSGSRRLAWNSGSPLLAEAARLAYAREREPAEGEDPPASEGAGGGGPGILSFAFEHDGSRQLVQVQRHVDPRGLDWRIVTVVPQADFLSAIKRDTQLTVGACVLALALAMVLGYLLARGVTRPVERLTAASRAVAAGEWESAAPESSVRELNDLSASFNQMGAELKEAFEALEDRVAARTAELERATAAAVAANEAKTEFLATVSHEIRTPLSTILGYVELLRSGELAAEDADRSLRTIRDSGLHLNHLVGDLLDVGRIESGRLQLDTASCDLAELVAHLASMFAARAGERGLSLEVETRGELPWRFAADATRIRQIVSNLLSNAVRYTEQGTVRLEVSVAEAEPDRERARLSFAVSDTGPGVREEDRERIFERFTQAKESEGGGGSGFGLGLWITRQLASRMGGRIALESRVGEGSTFTATLPVEECSEWGVRDAGASAPQPSVASPRLAGRVLVVEDSASLRELCRHRLERWGIDCATSEEGRAGVELALAEPFDVILMDWQMPRVDGLEATRELRRRGVKTPIVALTAAAMAGDRERCLAAGCDRYLAKPIDFRALHRTLAELLPDRIGTGSQPSTAAGPTDPLAELVQRYVARLPSAIEELGEALRAEDWARLRALTHKLVGTSGSYGLSEVSTLASALEGAVADEELDASRRQIEELELAVSRRRNDPNPLGTDSAGRST